MDLKNNKITVGELMDHPGARAVFQKRFPMVMKHPLLGAARTVTLEQVLAFAQALEELKEEGGVPARHARYDQNQRLLAENFRALGFVPYLDPAVQGPIITTFRYPAGARFTFQQMYEYIKARGYVLYPGKVMEAETFRVGNIGEIYPEDIAKLSAILADFLKEVAA